MCLMREEPLEAACDPVLVSCKRFSKAILLRSSSFRSVKLPDLILSTTFAGIGGSANEKMNGEALIAVAGGEGTRWNH